MESVEEVALAIKDADQQLVGKGMKTADFTTMYTQLPHSKLVQSVETAWDRAEEYKIQQEGHSAWVLERCHEGLYSFQKGIAEEGQCRTDVMDKQKFLLLMQHLIKENYIHNGAELRIQTVGIPMGSPVSPQLAALYRYSV